MVCNLLTTPDYAVCGLLPSEQLVTSKQAPNHHDTVAPSIAQPYTTVLRLNSEKEIRSMLYMYCYCCIALYSRGLSQDRGIMSADPTS